MKSAKLQNWINLINCGKIKSDVVKVLDYVIKHDGCLITDISDGLNMPIQTVTARLSDIMDEGAIRFGKIVNVKNSNYSQLHYVYPDEIAQVKAERLEAKFQIWLNNGLKNYYTRIPEGIYEQLKTLKKPNIVEGKLDTLFV
jgi:DNA-binding MarR family transcriptional regulator